MAEMLLRCLDGGKDVSAKPWPIKILEIREVGNAPPVMLWRDEYGTVFSSPIVQRAI